VRWRADEQAIGRNSKRLGNGSAIALPGGWSYQLGVVVALVRQRFFRRPTLKFKKNTIDNQYFIFIEKM